MKDFAFHFGRAPAIHAEAPGRVNLIGEHTDYNGGFVLPTTIPQRTRIELARREDDLVRVVSANCGASMEEYRLGAEQPGRGWVDYVQGVTQLLRHGGHQLRGFDALVTSAVPVGSGLSSSAALTVSLQRALRLAFGLGYDDMQIARRSQQAENAFVGAQVGIMDPMAASLGEAGHALFIDTRSLDYERVPLPANAELVVINSGLAHQHAAGDYNARRAECEQACHLLGVRQLRELDLTDLPSLDNLPEPIRRRARHVITENDRVLAAVHALKAGDVGRLGQLFYDSHVSQRDDYCVSIPEIDLLVELARADAAVYGARLTGGGFGGSIVALARAGDGAAVGTRIVRAYQERTGRTATLLTPAVNA